MDLVDLDADGRGGPREARLLEALAPMRVAPDVRDAPVLQDAGEPGVGVVVDHHHRGAAQVELLHGPQSDALQPAHDDVAAPAFGRCRIHAGMLST